VRPTAGWEHGHDHAHRGAVRGLGPGGGAGGSRRRGCVGSPDRSTRRPQSGRCGRRSSRSAADRADVAIAREDLRFQALPLPTRQAAVAIAAARAGGRRSAPDAGLQHDLEGAADDIARWRAKQPTDGARYRNTRALRECLAAAERWRYMTRNPAVDAGPNPEPRAEELHPFTRGEIDKLAKELGAVYGPLAIFGAETGLRTNEWVAVERRDIDRTGKHPAVIVQRRVADGVLTPYPKTQRRRVPLSDRAVEAVDAIAPPLDTPLLFPAIRGGYIGLEHLAHPRVVPRARGRRDRHARSLPPAPHLRHRGARRRDEHLPALPRDGSQREDDRQALRPPRARQRGQHPRSAQRQSQTFWR
jgi:integrase